MKKRVGRKSGRPHLGAGVVPVPSPPRGIHPRPGPQKPAIAAIRSHDQYAAMLPMP